VIYKNENTFILKNGFSRVRTEMGNPPKSHRITITITIGLPKNNQITIKITIGWPKRGSDYDYDW
jgi:hypothetical protein